MQVEPPKAVSIVRVASEDEATASLLERRLQATSASSTTHGCSPLKSQVGVSQDLPMLYSAPCWGTKTPAAADCQQVTTAGVVLKSVIGLQATQNTGII
jgi:hypothetical protein